MSALTYKSVSFCFYSSTSLFRQIKACLTSICNSPICVFPALFVLAGSSNQEHFCMPEMGFGVEETFQRFFLTLTPMFSQHIKLLGGPPDRFFLTTLRKNVVPEKIVQKVFCFFLPQVLLDLLGQWWSFNVDPESPRLTSSKFLPTTQVLLSCKLMHNVEIPVKLWSHGEKSNKVSPQWQPQNKRPGLNLCLNA